ncbi:hypothetical protein [Fastidiosibacter lacustris]|uniref:hypothetical protein n=1 Tax=Fastidiosibacter lacustris TaxID=2056695 RepID=UPI000E355FD3|nr:hypothetical protein [Fastidiosibacter lacustris]
MKHRMIRCALFFVALNSAVAMAYTQTNSSQTYAIDSTQEYYKSIQAQDHLHAQIEQQALENKAMQQKIDSYKLQRQLAAIGKSKASLSGASAKQGDYSIEVAEVSKEDGIWEAVIWYHAKKHELKVGDMLEGRYKVASINANKVILLDATSLDKERYLTIDVG